MTSKQPLVKQSAWLSIIPQLLILSIFIVLASRTGTESPAIIGVLAYFSALTILRRTVAVQHRRGIAHFRKKEFAPALERFQQSYDYFCRHKWVDEWRYITLLSSSRTSYREMALLNIAYCYSQLEKEVEAKEFYQKTLREFPNSAMAKAAIDMMESAIPDQANT